jgi:hypothetical protein
MDKIRLPSFVFYLRVGEVGYNLLAGIRRTSTGLVQEQTNRKGGTGTQQGA